VISKEWRDARWKLLVATIVVLLLVPNLTPYEEILKMAEEPPPTEDPEDNPNPASERPYTDAEKIALREMAGFYLEGGSVIIVPLAVLIGASLISAEVSNGTIFLLLSRPVGRIRLLLTKYGVDAATLLAAAVLGTLLLIIVAAMRGYPLEGLSFTGITLSAVQMWLGSLFVLSVALLVSVILRSVLASIVATIAVLLFVFTFPNSLFFPLELFVFFFGDYPNFYADYEWLWKLNLLEYWADEDLFLGGAVPVTDFFILGIAAVVPLVAALWLFDRKAY
jgi:ABC-type transport system involved in multi-copper enzyme maturation permease subunit